MRGVLFSDQVLPTVCATRRCKRAIKILEQLQIGRRLVVLPDSHPDLRLRGWQFIHQHIPGARTAALGPTVGQGQSCR